MDPHIAQLRDLFLSHPAWLDAASHIKDGAQSRVSFSHISGDFYMIRKDGKSLLLPGEAKDPDFAFYFTPKAIERLAMVQGRDLADFAVELFDCIVSDDPELQVGLRILSSFPKLFWRGYVGLLMKGGPRVLSYGASRGVTSMSDLRRFLKQSRASDPRWEKL
jgi:hypothetical protein